MRKHLRNFDTYYDKIVVYGKAIGIAIEVKPEDCEGMYLPSRRVIRIDDELSETATIAILLHEFGHHYDGAGLDANTHMELNDAYEAIAKDKATTRHKAIHIAHERKAWDCGRIIARNLKIPLGKWYEDVRLDCLKSHSESV
jgi:hypothetical protein